MQQAENHTPEGFSGERIEYISGYHAMVMHRLHKISSVQQVPYTTQPAKMAFKFLAVCALFAVARAGLVAPVAYSAAPAVSHFSYSSPVVSYGQTYPGQQPAITSQSSNILRSYGNLGQVSTYSKTIDTPFSSVSKSDVRVSNPGLTTYATAPVVAHATYAAPVVKAAPVLAHATYAAPVVKAAPVLAHATYAAPAPVVKAAPVAGLLGVAYSAAPVVSHMTYTNGLVSYAY